MRHVRKKVFKPTVALMDFVEWLIIKKGFGDLQAMATGGIVALSIITLLLTFIYLVGGFIVRWMMKTLIGI